MTNPAEAQIEALGRPVQAAIKEIIQEAFHEGKENKFWQGTKHQRTEFGVNGILTPFITFASEEEYANFLKDPKSIDGFGCAYTDLGNLDEWCTRVGYVGKAEALKPLFEALIDGCVQPWEIPLLIVVCFPYLGSGPDGGSVSIFLPAMVEWWDTEADTIPRTDVTREDIEYELDQLNPYGVASRVMFAMDARDPRHAGPNLNLWLDACEERNISPMLSAESADALHDLSPEHQGKFLIIPAM